MKQVLRSSILLAALVLANGARAQSADNEAPLAWLQKAVKAAQSTAYNGTFIYRCNEKVHTVSVSQRVSSKGVEEDLVALDGLRREIRSASDQVVYQTSDSVRTSEKTFTRHRNPLSSINLDKFGEVVSYYELTLGETERVINRSARQLNVLPRDNWRYGYRLWVDEATGLLLKSDLVDQTGRLLEQMAFTSIDVVGVTENLVAQPNDTNSSQGGNVLLFMDLPPGFDMRSYVVDKTQRGGDVQHWVLTDGLASVSVFMEEMKPEAKPFIGISKMGGVKAYGKIMGDAQITLIGELPDASLRRISQGLRLPSKSP